MAEFQTPYFEGLEFVAQTMMDITLMADPLWKSDDHSVSSEYHREDPDGTCWCRFHFPLRSRFSAAIEGNVAAYAGPRALKIIAERQRRGERVQKPPKLREKVRKS
jgi:hypothetical protein